MARMEQSLGRVGGMIKAHLALMLAEMAARLVETAKAAVEAVEKEARRGLFEAVSYGFGAAVGFGLVLVLFSSMRERLEAADVPAAWRGTPIALVTAGLMSLAFMGFTGMVPA